MVKSAFLRLAGNCREISKIILLCYEGKKNCFYLGEMVHNYSCLEAADRTPIHLKFHIQRLLVFCMWFSLGVLVCPLTSVSWWKKTNDPCADKYSLLCKPPLSYLILND